MILCSQNQQFFFKDQRGLPNLIYRTPLKCGDSEIELFIVKNAPKRVSNPEALGLRHLAFKVESVNDTVEELNKLGIECEPVRMDDYTHKAMTFFRDPDNLPIEIHE